LGRFIVDCIEYILIHAYKKIAFIGVPYDGDKAEE